MLKNIRKPLYLALAAFFLLRSTGRAQYVFTTIDDPVAKAANGQTFVTGISGNTIVGYYFSQPLHSFYHVLGTTNYTTLDVPLGLVNGTSSTEAFGISGGNIVGNYQNNNNGAAGYYGFLYNIASANYQTLDVPAGDYQNASHTWPTAIDGANIVGYVAASPSIYLNYVGGFEAQYNGAGFAYGTPFYYPSISQITVAAGYDTTNYSTYLNGISGNNAVGYYVDINFVSHGILYNLTSGAYTPVLSPSGAGCTLTGIDGNNVVGYYADPNHSYNYSGFIYNIATGKYTATSIRDPQAPQNTFLRAISGNTLAGYYLDVSGLTHGFVASIPVPVMNLAVTKTNMVISATNGYPGSTCYVISTTNFDQPRSQWTVISTNTFNTNGIFSISKTGSPVGTYVYFGLK